MKLYRFIFALLCVFISTNIAFATPDYNQIIFFGDSLTDNGNLYHADLKLLPKSPPYYEGRFSNGKTWAEWIAAYYANNNITSENYAVGGETVFMHNPFGGFLPYMLSESISNYFLHSAFHDKSHTLFIIWIGANDYITGTPDIDQVTTHVVNTIKDNVDNLISHGGKNFILLNLPDLSRTPSSQAAGTMQFLSAITAMHNEKLNTMVSQLQNNHPEMSIRLFDLNSIFTQLLDHPDIYNTQYQLHITNTTDACWPGGYTLQRLSAAQLEAELAHSALGNKINLKQFAESVVNSPDLAATYQVGQSYLRGETPCNDPDANVFWDQLHPTAAVHQLLGQIMIDYINQTQN
jgi:phospholipase/lecithinase/hemolysin